MSCGILEVAQTPGDESNEQACFEESIVADFPEYRFKWKLFGEGEIIFPDFSISSYFSRACLYDLDLLNCADELAAVVGTIADDQSLNTREETEEDRANQAETHEEGSAVGDSNSDKEDEDSFTDAEEDLIRKMESLNLPTSFGKLHNRQEGCRRHKRPPKNRSRREKSPQFDSFDDYFKWNGDYLYRKSWFTDYPESFSTVKDAEEFDHYTDEHCAPQGLLKAHKDLEMFCGLSYPKDDPAFPYQTKEEWANLYKDHIRAVREQAQKDYEKYEELSKKRRCLSFTDKLIKVGLAYKANGEYLTTVGKQKKKNIGPKKSASNNESVGDMDTSNGDDGDLGVQVGTSNAYTSPITSDSTDMVDVRYYFDIPYGFVSKKRQVKQNEVLLEVEAARIPDLNESSVAELKMSSDLVWQNFDFSYNEERDKWLLAKNALKTFKHDKDMPKYYNQRFRLFSKLNKGILMDREGWYSVTPERIAAHISDRVILKKDALILDGFGGVGGNSIQFALKGAYVIALDKDPIRLRCAKRNAEIYGVADRITFICTDYFNFCKRWSDEKLKKGDGLEFAVFDKILEDEVDVAEELKTRNNERKIMPTADDYKDGIQTVQKDAFDAVFLSPPWGGPAYRAAKVFSLKDMEPDGYKIFHSARQLTSNIAYFLPKQTDNKELLRVTKYTGGVVEIEQAELNGKVKAITAYYGNLVCGMQ